MAKAVEFTDVNGSFARMCRTAPDIAREALRIKAIKETAFAVKGRVDSAAPVGPDAPHIRGDATVRTYKKLYALVGYWPPAQANRGEALPTQAMVALFNEYSPNHQPFMRSSTKAESGGYLRRATDALRDLERKLRIE